VDEKLLYGEVELEAEIRQMEWHDGLPKKVESLYDFKYYQMRKKG